MRRERFSFSPHRAHGLVGIQVAGSDLMRLVAGHWRCRPFQRGLDLIGTERRIGLQHQGHGSRHMRGCHAGAARRRVVQRVGSEVDQVHGEEAVMRTLATKLEGTIEMPMLDQAFDL